MSQSDLDQAFPNLDRVTEYYLAEVLYCLEHYLGMSREQAYHTLVSSKDFKRIVTDFPFEIQRETGYYWAMYLAYGERWWLGRKDLVIQHVEYIKTRHNPPLDTDNV